MNERDQPFEKKTFGKERVELTPRNTAIYQHLGAHAMFDHIFVHWSRPEPRPEGMGYIWNDSPMYPDILQRAILHGVAQHMNLDHAAEIDIENWVKHHSDDLEKKRPEWLPEV